MPPRPGADYALVTVLEHLGTDPDALDADWADFVGDASTVSTFDVTTETPTDAYVELQTYDVGSFGHETLINGDPLTGFDVPPARGWQQWTGRSSAFVPPARRPTRWTAPTASCSTARSSCSRSS